MALIRRGLALLHIVLALWFSVLCPATQAQPQAQAQAQAQAPGATILTDENYDALVTSSSDLWLLEFYAPWCGHCKRLRPILDELAQSPSAAFPMKVGVMDATREQAVPGKFGIKSFPTIKFFKDGVYGKYEGPRTLEAFQKFGERMHGECFRLWVASLIRKCLCLTPQNDQFPPLRIPSEFPQAQL